MANDQTLPLMNIVFGNLIGDFSNASSMDVKTMNEVLAGAINKNTQVFEPEFQFTANGLSDCISSISSLGNLCSFISPWLLCPPLDPLSCILMLHSFVSGSSGRDSQLPLDLTISVPCSNSRYRSWTSFHQDQLPRRLLVAPIPFRLELRTSLGRSCNSRQ